MWEAFLRFFVDNKLIVFVLVAGVVVGGVYVSPFDWELGAMPHDRVPVDAIPDIGENQQIVFTEWQGRSPRDVEDQVSYPLTTALLGIPGVRTVRSSSMFGFSTIYVIFEEGVEFYWSRSRVL
ncbi:MAG: efflux RND transporter permease subunit, partial [Deltaproteobacteria bacterium]|nr:efflux RND transporter permease subunit [Deltaproteobacteria bacterium]